jgi:hypothetical protein
MDKRLTEWEALDECEKMWDWLADNPKKEKIDYLNEAATVDPDYRVVAHNCFACEYFNQQNNNDDAAPVTVYNDDGETIGYGCDCILKNLWPNGCEHGEDYTVYENWVFAESKDRSKHAKQIADGCREAKRLLK